MSDTKTNGAEMRRVLLAKLPVLEYRGQSVLAGLELDEDNDLRGAVEVDVDAFLAPLEAVKARRS